MFPAEGYDPSALEAVQLEDGSTAYIHHPVAVPSDSAILAVQTEVGLEDLAAEDDEGFSADTVVALEQYASKVSSQSPTLPVHSLGPNCHHLRGQGPSCAWAWPELLPLSLHSASPDSSLTGLSSVCMTWDHTAADAHPGL